MWKKRSRWLLRGGAVRGGSLYPSLCFCICLKFFTVKSLKKMKWVQCAHCTDGQKKPQKQAGRLEGTGEWGILVCWQWGSIPGLGLPAWHLRRRLWGLPEPGAWRGISPIIQDSAFWHFVAATLSHLSLYLWEASFCLFVWPPSAA